MKIIKQRRRTMLITVEDNGEVLVKAPLFLSNMEINDFIEKKRNWILAQKKKVAEKSNLMSNYDFKNYVYINGEKLLWESVKTDRRTTKSSFYTKKFEDLARFAEEIALNYNKKPQIKLCNSRCIWGSCNNKNVIKLNWKLLILPKNLQKYVICHEIAHLFEMNHSKKFWNCVEKMDPDFLTDKKELKNYSFLLKTEVLA